ACDTLTRRANSCDTAHGPVSAPMQRKPQSSIRTYSSKTPSRLVWRDWRVVVPFGFDFVQRLVDLFQTPCDLRKLVGTGLLLHALEQGLLLLEKFGDLGHHNLRNAPLAVFPGSTSARVAMFHQLARSDRRISRLSRYR